jgi:hypothetical protein
MTAKKEREGITIEHWRGLTIIEIVLNFLPPL